MCQLHLVIAVSMLLLCASPSFTAQCMEDMEGATEGMKYPGPYGGGGGGGGGRKGIFLYQI